MDSRLRSILCAGALIWGVLPVRGAEPILRVGTSGDYLPFSGRTAEGYDGFDIAVAERFAGETGLRLSFVPFRWPELSQAMRDGRFDVAMSGVTVRPERSILARFTVPVVETGAVLLVREAAWRRLVRDPARALAELDSPSLAVAVNAGGHLERVTRAHLSRADLRPIPDNASVRRALASGEVEAVVTDTLEAPGWLQGLEDVRLVGPFTRDRKAYWVRADDASLAGRLDAWLMAAERDGSLAALRREWFGDAMVSRMAMPLAALLSASDERLSLMSAVAESKRGGGRGIVDRAREARVLEAAWTAVAGAADRAGLERPRRSDVERFYRAQIDAAVSIQQRVLAAPAAPGAASFDLAREIRPALLRIGDRMATLLVLAAGDPAARAPDLEMRVEEALSRHRLPPERIREIADAIAAFVPPARREAGDQPPAPAR